MTSFDLTRDLFIVAGGVIIIDKIYLLKIFG